MAGYSEYADQEQDLERAFDHLSALSDVAGPAGFESQVTDYTAASLSALGWDVRSDALGSCIARLGASAAARRGAETPLRVMLAAHCDEIGLMITAVEKTGFLRFTTIGGIDSGAIYGREVVVQGRRPVAGIIATTPPHITPVEDRRRWLPPDELVIDIGLSQEAAEQAVRPGDPVTFHEPLRRLAGGRAAGKALDNRAGLAAMLLAGHELAERRRNCEIFLVATVQEEVGLRGALTSAFGIVPHVGIAVDTTMGAQPSTSPARTCLLDGGPAVGVGPNIHPAVHRALLAAGRSGRLPCQLEPLPANSGTDAWAMQVTRAGVATGVVSVPIRNMHTPVETVSLRDILWTARLLAEFTATADTSLRPALTGLLGGKFL